MRKLFAIAIIVLLAAGCGGTTETFMDGPKEDKGIVGALKPLPDEVQLRDLGDGMQKYVMEFNFKGGIAGQINPLTNEQTTYLLEEKASAGSPQINPDVKVAGNVEIVYTNGSIGQFDKTTGRFSTFEISPDLVPPMDIEYSGENRKMTEEIAIRIAKLWFKQIDIDITNYKANPITVAETTEVVMTEMLRDTGTISPNYVKVLINHWGMIVKYENHTGPTPKIGTKPTLDKEAIIEKAKGFLAVPKDFDLNINPIKVIKRIYSEEKDNLVYFDRLAWFIDASGLKLEARNQILTLNAHTGMPIQ